MDWQQILIDQGVLQNIMETVGVLVGIVLSAALVMLREYIKDHKWAQDAERIVLTIYATIPKATAKQKYDAAVEQFAKGKRISADQAKVFIESAWLKAKQQLQ